MSHFQDSPHHFDVSNVTSISEQAAPPPPPSLFTRTKTRRISKRKKKRLLSSANKEMEKEKEKEHHRKQILQFQQQHQHQQQYHMKQYQNNHQVADESSQFMTTPSAPATTMQSGVRKSPSSESPLDASFSEREEINWGETWKLHVRLARAHPQNLVLTIFIFFILIISGAAISTVFAKAQRERYEADATDLARETALFFSEELNNAILPLFSMAQFVNELEIFQSLPEKIGLKGEEGSLPFIEKEDKAAVPTHRNITGVCDEPTLVQRFNSIAKGIKENAKMEGILVNVQLVPDAVVCLLYPLNNTEDFPDGVYMDNSGALGHDLLSDPNRKFIAEATVPQEDVVIAGPLSLTQCQGCDPTVEKAFIARLPIASKMNNTIPINGVDYNRWGFAVALINWNELIIRSGVYNIFNDDDDLEFQLTRVDTKYNETTDTYSETVVILAGTDGFAEADGRNVTVDFEGTYNEWKMTVTYCASSGGVCVGWYKWTIVACLILSTCISCLVYTIFSQKQLHADALSAKSRLMAENAKRAAKAERELNDFIAHEVRNPLAAAISACSFVSASVNEVEPLVTEDSKECVRDDVRIIEASLSFINDLLRSMLDLHRARSKQLKLELVPTDIKQDILNPVASMIYRRDDLFDVSVDCPDNVVVMVDRLRLKQIILNLARNSAKFVESGFVRLTATILPPAGNLVANQSKMNTILNDDHLVDGYVPTSSPSLLLPSRPSSPAPPPPSYLCICVEDSGPGIPDEKRDKLYARFQQALDELQQGTGIGLSLCKKLIDLMGGRITLDNDYDSGIPGKPGARFIIELVCELLHDDSTAIDDEAVDDVNVYQHEHNVANGNVMMTSSSRSSLPQEQQHALMDGSIGSANGKAVTLPTDSDTKNSDIDDLEDFVDEHQQHSTRTNNHLPSQQQQQQQQQQQTKVLELPDQLSILFVDDDMVLRKLFARSLKRVKPTWDVKEASNGETALMMVEQNTYDVIFVDQYMTSVEKQLLGTETCRLMRSRGCTSLICGLSANDMEGPFHAAGADAFMMKPFPCRPDPLREELLRVLNSRSNIIFQSIAASSLSSNMKTNDTISKNASNDNDTDHNKNKVNNIINTTNIPIDTTPTMTMGIKKAPSAAIVDVPQQPNGMQHHHHHHQHPSSLAPQPPPPPSSSLPSQSITSPSPKQTPPQGQQQQQQQPRDKVVFNSYLGYV